LNYLDNKGPELDRKLFSTNNNKEYILDTIYISKNISQYILLQEKTKSDFRSQESTALLENKESIISNNTSYPGLQLTFNPEPKADPGLVLRTSLDYNIVLPQLQKIS